MSFQSFYNTESYFGKEDQKFLYENLLVNYTDPVTIAEVGNHTWTSAKYFSANLHPDSTIHSIDITENTKPDNFPANVKSKILESINWFPPNRLDFVYLDGDHDPEYVYKEIKHFEKYTDIIAGHDGGQVAQAIMKILGEKEQRIQFTCNSFSSSWILRYDR